MQLQYTSWLFKKSPKGTLDKKVTKEMTNEVANVSNIPEVKSLITCFRS